MSKHSEVMESALEVKEFLKVQYFIFSLFPESRGGGVPSGPPKAMFETIYDSSASTQELEFF